MSTDAEILGRDDVNDIDAILAITNTDRDEVIHAVKDNADAIFTWDYEKGQRPALNRLYENPRIAPERPCRGHAVPNTGVVPTPGSRGAPTVVGVNVASVVAEVEPVWLNPPRT